jgi:hypothetical protein
MKSRSQALIPVATAPAAKEAQRKLENMIMVYEVDRRDSTVVFNTVTLLDVHIQEDNCEDGILL